MDLWKIVAEKLWQTFITDRWTDKQRVDVRFVQKNPIIWHAKTKSVLKYQSKILQRVVAVKTVREICFGQTDTHNDRKW